jgi:hypothetical protein
LYVNDTKTTNLFKSRWKSSDNPEPYLSGDELLEPGDLKKIPLLFPFPRIEDDTINGCEYYLSKRLFILPEGSISPEEDFKPAKYFISPNRNYRNVSFTTGFGHLQYENLFIGGIELAQPMARFDIAPGQYEEFSRLIDSPEQGQFDFSLLEDTSDDFRDRGYCGIRGTYIAHPTIKNCVIRDGIFELYVGKSRNNIKLFAEATYMRGMIREYRSEDTQIKFDEKGYGIRRSINSLNYKSSTIMDKTRLVTFNMSETNFDGNKHAYQQLFSGSEDYFIEGYSSTEESRIYYRVITDFPSIINVPNDTFEELQLQLLRGKYDSVYIVMESSGHDLENEMRPIHIKLMVGCIFNGWEIPLKYLVEFNVDRKLHNTLITSGPEIKDDRSSPKYQTLIDKKKMYHEVVDTIFPPVLSSIIISYFLTDYKKLAEDLINEFVSYDIDDIISF